MPTRITFPGFPGSRTSCEIEIDPRRKPRASEPDILRWTEEIRRTSGIDIRSVWAWPTPPAPTAEAELPDLEAHLRRAAHMLLPAGIWDAVRNRNHETLSGVVTLLPACLESRVFFGKGQ